jgi:nitroreductase
MTQSSNSIPVSEAIFGRCSVRAYAPEKIDQETLLSLLAAAVRAPTAMHGEPWQFVIIQDADMLKRLSARAKAIFSDDAARLHRDSRSVDLFRDPDFNVFYDAGTLVVIFARSSGEFASADCWLAAENLMLAAYARGLGTCVIGLAVSALNLPDVKHELGIPVEATAVAPIIIGRPSGAVAPSSRHEPQILAWRQ